MLKFLFTFHIFVLEGSVVNRIDSQFVFDSLIECRTAEMLIQKREDPNNCDQHFTEQANNNAVDNLDLTLRSYNRGDDI